MIPWISKNTPEKEALIRNVLSSWNPSIDLKDMVLLPGGSNSTAVRAGETVYRFPQTEEAFLSMQQEAILIRILNQHFPDALRSEIAEVFIVDEDNFPSFSYHRYISGKIMDNIRGETEFNTCYFHLPPEDQDRLARETAAFLAGLHSVKTDLFQTQSLWRRFAVLESRLHSRG